MAITAGTYTIGQAGSGATYATANAFIQDISSSGLSGDLTGNLIANAKFNLPPAYVYYIKLNGYKLKFTSNIYHNGYWATSVPILTFDTTWGAQLYCRSDAIDTGSIEFSGMQLYIDSLSFGTGTGHNYDSNVKCFFFNNIVKRNTSFTGQVAISLSTKSKVLSSVYAFNNIFYNSGTLGTSTYLQVANGVNFVTENNYFFKYYLNVPIITTGKIQNNIFHGSKLSMTNTVINDCMTDQVNNTALNASSSSLNVQYGLTFTTGDIYFTSYDISNIDYLKILTTNTGAITGATPLITENTTGIRLNARPASGKTSIGADQFTPITDVSLGGFDLPYPQYPYKTDIFFSWDFVKSSTDKYHFFDNGALYDKRKCVATFLLSETEAEKLKQLWNSYKTSYTTAPLSLIMGDDSGWFPFGQDKGNKGGFKVELNLLSKIERSKTHFNYFEATLELINVDAYPDYTFVDEVNEGSFAISNATGTYSISNIRTPEYEVEGQYGTFTNQNEGGIDYNRTIELNEETQETRFILNTNLSKMQRVLKLITDNRTGNYTISDGGGNIFGYSFNLLQENLKLVENKFTVTANKFNDYTIDLRFTNE
jgi:hypothetical protein